MLENYQQHLNSIKEKNNYRFLRTVESCSGKYIEYQSKSYLNFSSNDYLGLSQNSEIINFIKEQLTQVGNCSSRLVSGHNQSFENLEKEISQWRGFEQTLITTNGYATNVGILSSLKSPKGETLFFFDEFCHASIVDGILLSKSKWFRFRHNDVEDLKKKIKKFSQKDHQIIIVTESVFSMNGEIAPIQKLLELSQNHNAIFYLDEAHSIGVFGKERQGFSKEMNLGKFKNVITVATMGKALGSFGAFVNSSEEMKDYFINTCRSFIFSTALPQSILLSCQKAIQLLKNDFKSNLLELAKYFREKCLEKKIPLVSSNSHIICVFTGRSDRAIELQQQLMKNGIFAIAIRPPTVKGSRIRFTISHFMHQKDIDFCLEVLEKFFN